MGIHRGPNTVKDGLVFGYDTGYGVADNSTATRFYPGEPATNNSILAAYTWNGDGGNQSFANKGATAITDNSLKYNGYDTVLWTPGGSQNCYLNGTGDFNYSDGSTVWTFSCYVKREDGAAITSLNVYMYYPSSDGAAAGTIVDCGNGWYRVSRTRTGGTSAIQLGGFTGFSAGNKYYLSGVMLSKTNHTVPYVAVQSSRSSTASLIDLKKTTDISMSNVSFDSTGQPTFDGTDDLINLDSYASIIPVGGSITIDSMVLWDDLVANSVAVSYGGNQTGSGFLFQYEGTAGLEFVLFDGNGNSGRAKILAANSTQYLDKYIHMVGTYDGSTVLLYINGVQAATASYTNGYPTQSYFRIGNEYNRSYFGNIDLSVLKIYNKALTATEVKQNYNAYKNRFDI